MGITAVDFPSQSVAFFLLSSSMVADSIAFSTGVQTPASGVSQPCINWWSNSAARLLDSRNQFRICHFQVESCKVGLLSGLLSHLLVENAFQLPNSNFGILQEKHSIRTVSIGRHLIRLLSDSFA